MRELLEAEFPNFIGLKFSPYGLILGILAGWGSSFLEGANWTGIILVGVIVTGLSWWLTFKNKV